MAVVIWHGRSFDKWFHLWSLRDWVRRTEGKRISLTDKGRQVTFFAASNFAALALLGFGDRGCREAADLKNSHVDDGL
jgi:hypothetical protein